MQQKRSEHYIGWECIRLSKFYRANGGNGFRWKWVGFTGALPSPFACGSVPASYPIARAGGAASGAGCTRQMRPVGSLNSSPVGPTAPRVR